MKDKLNEIEESFFKHVANDEQDLEAIKVRGEMNMAAEPESPHKAFNPDEDFKVGSKYGFQTEDGVLEFVVQEGGIISGEEINGTV